MDGSIRKEPMRLWGGQGDGSLCHYCGTSIEAHEVLYEVAFGASGDIPLAAPGTRTGKFHLRCLDAWRQAPMAARWGRRPPHSSAARATQGRAHVTLRRVVLAGREAVAR
jgi:hypothetical protein